MRLNYLPEFTALLVAHAQRIATHPEQVTQEAIGRVYLAFRDRSNRLLQEVDHATRADELFGGSAHGPHPLISLGRRILINDLLVRVWCAIAVHVDETRETKEIAPIARNVHLNQMILRHRVLSRILAARTTTARDIAGINSLRERVERWCDMLLGQLPVSARQSYAFDSRRVSDFGTAYGREPGPSNHAWPLVLAGLRGAFERDLPASECVSPDDRAVLIALLRTVNTQVTWISNEELTLRATPQKHQ